MGNDHMQRFRKRGFHIKMRYRKQESEILRVLSKLNFSSMLEVGCGFGRMTDLIMGTFQAKFVRCL